MLQKFIALTFLLSFTAQTFSKPLIVLDYFTNTESFSRKCENKAKPKLRCNGKCQMMKKLEKEEKKEQQEERKGNIKTEVLSSRSFFTTLEVYRVLADITFCITEENTILGTNSSVFHPPGA